MYPLLAAGASAVAQNLVQSLGGMMQRKLNPAGAAKFDAVLAQSEAPAVAARPLTAEEQIAALRSQLLQAPELQTMINTADPAKAASLSISPTGSVSFTGADGRAGTITLSPETASLAQSLGAKLSQARGTASAGNFPLMLTAPRSSLNVYA